MKKGTQNLLLYGGAAAAAYFLFIAPPGATANSPLSAGSNLLSSLLPSTAPAAIPTTYGINSGVRGNLHGVVTVSNYAQLLAANPNLGNPNYSMSAAEMTQYLNNYLDLQQYWNQPSTEKSYKNNLQACMQDHWRNYGCAEKRIFLPLQPPSGIAFVPAPPAPKSSGSGVLGSILKVVTIAAGAAITVATGGAAAPLVAAGESAALTAESAIHGTGDFTPLLNDTQLQMIFEGAAVLNDILPMYLNSDRQDVSIAQLQLNSLLTQYS